MAMTTTRIGCSFGFAGSRVRFAGSNGWFRRTRYCIDILTQITAITGALNKVAVSLLEDHLGHCVADSLVAGADADANVREAALAVQRLLRA